MEQQLTIYNTLTKKKEIFTPLHPNQIGLYVCGPTVYGDPHLGHAKAAITFDIVFRYFIHFGYKVRYVRNITDVGHLVYDSDSGEDKIAKKARLENLEPMEVVQYYLNRYHKAMDKLNVLPPSIEPHASGHIIEQIQLIKEILSRGYAYESNGSVYFDMEEYNKKYHYGILSGRQVEENTIKTTRKLEGQEEKRRAVDFALWKKASREHIMHWPSPWSDGFPGWHLECTAMSKKYLGETFDIHGGGMDLIFPHHECEIAQSIASTGKNGVRYWMHSNMVTINGQKMGKSLDNFITLEELFSGTNNLLTQSYSTMTIRFFLLQAHYRSTVNFSNEALQAAERGLAKLFDAYNSIKKLNVKTKKSIVNISELKLLSFNAMNNDFNTPIVISYLFKASRIIFSALAEKILLTAEDIQQLKEFFQLFLFDLLGIKNELQNKNISCKTFEKSIDLLLSIRLQAKQNKDWITSDKIRHELVALGIEVNDNEKGSEWKLRVK